MLFKVVHTRKVFATRITLVWLLARMYPSMFNQIVLLKERFATLFTCELFCPIVIFFVSGKNVTIGEGGITDITGVWPLPRMCPDVVSEFTGFTELLLTLLARQVPFIAMDGFYVFIQPFGHNHLVAD